MQTKLRRWRHQSEQRWVGPSYSGGLLLALAIFFFVAATNTLAGWLYVISGLIFALATIAAIGARSNLRGIQIERGEIIPVSAGEELEVSIEFLNPTAQAKQLVQLCDYLPPSLGAPAQSVLEVLPPGARYRWEYRTRASGRGLYRWQTVTVRTGFPLGLCWAQGRFEQPTQAVVYPIVLQLSHCPILDKLGQDSSLTLSQARQVRAATEGLTRALRPYRWGDPMRSIHWRSSARYNELRVRELETDTSNGQAVTIALDTARSWPSEDFEQAVIAAATLYFYAQRCRQLDVTFWSHATGVIQSNILATLAAISPHELNDASPPSLDSPLIWLTANGSSIEALDESSRWILWANRGLNRGRGIVIDQQQSLQAQLQGLL